jgi:hypothetical protein
MNSPLEIREVRLRGLYPRVPRAAIREGAGRSPGCGRAAAWNAAHRRAAESAQADFAFSQRRIHSLLEADFALSVGVARSAAPRCSADSRDPRLLALAGRVTHG